MSASYGDIVFFAVVAIYLGFKLFSVLGRKNDEDSKIEPRNNSFAVSSLPAGIDKKEVMVTPVNRAVEEVPLNNLENFVFASESVKNNVREIIAKDSTFSMENFIAGAKAAFEMLLKAYSQQDKKTLKQLLSVEMYNRLEKEIDNEIANKHTNVKSLVAFEQIEIESANATAGSIIIGLKFLTEQINSVKNETGETIEGDTKAIIVVEDNWVFEKNIRSSNPNWTINSL